LKPDVLKADVLKPDVLWVYQQQSEPAKGSCHWQHQHGRHELDQHQRSGRQQQFSESVQQERQHLAAAAAQ
jgi:hypothetical protein